MSNPQSGLLLAALHRARQQADELRNALDRAAVEHANATAQLLQGYALNMKLIVQSYRRQVEGAYALIKDTEFIDSVCPTCKGMDPDNAWIYQGVTIAGHKPDCARALWLLEHDRIAARDQQYSQEQTNED